MADTHICGSVPLQSSDEVFHTAMKFLKDKIRRLPDGETGERNSWIRFQFERLSEQDGIELFRGSLPSTNPAYHDYPRFKLTKPATEIEMPPLGYADPNLTSYDVFAGLKQEGVIPEPVRFMVALPTPYGMVAAACQPEDQLGFESVYKHALMGELARVCAGIPHDQLAVQWDIPCEVMIMEGEMPTPFADDELLDQVASRVAEAGNSIPAGAELGFHYCYGDYLGERFKEPDDLGVCVQIANAVAERLDHHCDFIHMPVPGLSADPAFYAPLNDLALGDTELYLGLVHFKDGLEGTQSRIAAARQAIPKDWQFGVSTECGMGRFPAVQLDKLLRIHADADTG